MKPGSYTLHDLFASRDIEQLVIPEIQRDYVWGERELRYLVEDLRLAAQACAEDPTTAPGQTLLDEEVYRSFRAYYSRQKHSHAVGFIYAYQDPAYPGKALLIDGQQRLTTLYLLMLACSMRQGASAPDCAHFRHFYLWQEAPKIDYRVREEARAFLAQFFSFILAGGAVQQVREQYWYFAEYDDDLTISSVLANYQLLIEILALPAYTVLTYQYLYDYVQFQYFDTNLSTQGEELYLSLNSTGHPTEENENIRALLLEKEPFADQRGWGTKWEAWQQFFWTNKKGNPNADYGFDEFLRWLCVLGLLANAKNGAANQLAENKIGKWQVIEDAAVGMAEVERLFQVVEYVHQHLAAAGDFFGPKWLAGGDTSRNQLTQVETFRLLPVLRYCLTRQAGPPPPAEMLHRVARYFYNISRSKSKIAGQPGAYVLAAIRLADALALETEDIAELPDLPGIALHHDQVLFSPEERWKLWQYRQPPSGLSREELEAQLRDLEDDEPNRGQVAHLFPEIDWHAPAPLTSKRLLEVRATYRQLFPEANELRAAQQQRLQSVLLGYAKYWQEVSPYYYTNCAFDEWYDTVRQAAFQQFFSEFLQAGVPLDVFSWQRQQVYFKGHTLAGLCEVRSIREQLFILAAAFDELGATGQPVFSMWQCGQRIGFKSTAETQNDYPFFAHDVCYVNARRYPYKDGEGNYMTIVDELARHSGVAPEQGVEWLLTRILAKINP